MDWTGARYAGTPTVEARTWIDAPAERVRRPGGLGVIPHARRAASRGGAQPAHLQRPPRPRGRRSDRPHVPARLGPLLAGCGT
jgi:hypothetical protein